MRKAILILGLSTTVAFAGSLTSQKNAIEADLKKLIKNDVPTVQKRCDDLEEEIAQFNKENDAQNTSVAAKRAEKKMSEEKIAYLSTDIDLLRAEYGKLLGALDAKKTALAAIKSNYTKTLQAKLDNVRTELDAAKKQKKELERSLNDLDNFNSQEDYLAALGKFYKLKNDTIPMLESAVAYILDLMSKPMPAAKTLEDEIKALTATVTAKYNELSVKAAQLADLTKANKKLADDLAALEKKVGALKNYAVPEICSKF